MEHTRQTCFKAYLLKKVKAEKGTEGFNSKPFGSAYNSDGSWTIGKYIVSKGSTTMLCIKICSLSSLKEYKNDLLRMLRSVEVLEELSMNSDEFLVKWWLKNTCYITTYDIVALCSSRSEKISSIGHELLKEFLEKLDKITSGDFDHYTKGESLSGILNLSVNKLNCSVFTTNQKSHSSEYLKILFALYTLGNRDSFWFSNEKENQKVLFSKIQAFELDGTLPVSRNLMDSFASIKSLDDLEKFTNGEGKNLEEFLGRRSIIESLSYIEDEELSGWILSNKKTPLITILNLACSDKKAIAASASKQLSVFLRNLEEYPSENLEKLLKENHLGKILSSTKAELVEQVKVSESKVKTWWQVFTKKNTGEKVQVGQIS